MATFGERLRELRHERGLSQDELAKALGVTPNTIFVWEKETRKPGRNFNPFKAAKYFDVSYFYLMGISDARKEEEPEITEEEVARMLDEDALVSIIKAVRLYCDLSSEMQFMVRETVEIAHRADKARRALKSQEADDRGEPYEDKVIALFESDYFKEAVESVFGSKNNEK